MRNPLSMGHHASHTVSPHRKIGLPIPVLIVHEGQCVEFVEAHLPHRTIDKESFISLRNGLSNGQHIGFQREKRRHFRIGEYLEEISPTILVRIGNQDKSVHSVLPQRKDIACQQSQFFPTVFPFFQKDLGFVDTRFLNARERNPKDGFDISSPISHLQDPHSGLLLTNFTT